MKRLLCLLAALAVLLPRGHAAEPRCVALTFDDGPSGALTERLLDGLYDTAVLQQTACADLPVILWSVDPEDWRVHDADAVTAHILRHAEPGSVILMHDLTDSSVTAALRVIDALQAQGYEFLTVSELAARSGTALTPGQAYCSFPP